MREAGTLAEARARSSARASTSCCSTCTSAASAARRPARRARRSGAIPVAVVTGSTDLEAIAGTQRRRGAREAVHDRRARVDGREARRSPDVARRLERMSTTAVRTPPNTRRACSSTTSSAPRKGRAVRVGEKEVSEQAAIVARYAISSPARRSRRCATRRRRAGRRARAALPAAQDVRGRRRLGGARGAGGRARERDPRRARHVQGRGAAAARRRRRGSPCSTRTRIARSSASSSGRRRRRSIPTGARCSRPREQLEADVTGEPDPVARNEEEKAISLRELERALVAASDATTDAYGRLRERWFEKLLGPERDAQPSNAHVHYLRRLSPLESTYTKEGAVDICLATTLALGFDMTAIPNIRLDLEDRPQKNPARLRDRVQSARRRASDHARAGRPLRLPGVHARGRPRAALRRRRSAAAVHVPHASRATTR